MSIETAFDRDVGSCLDAAHDLARLADVLLRSSGDVFVLNHRTTDPLTGAFLGLGGDGFRATTDELDLDLTTRGTTVGVLADALASYAGDLDLVDDTLQRARECAAAVRLLHGTVVMPPGDPATPRERDAFTSVARVVDQAREHERAADEAWLRAVRVYEGCEPPSTLTDPTPVRVPRLLAPPAPDVPAWPPPHGALPGEGDPRRHAPRPDDVLDATPPVPPLVEAAATASGVSPTSPGVLTRPHAPTPAAQLLLLGTPSARELCWP